MRSAETSGAGANGFGAAQTTDRGSAARREPKPARTPRVAALSPITVAVATTSLLCASLFIAYDTARTLQQAEHDLALPRQILSGAWMGAAPVQFAAAVQPDAQAITADAISASGWDAWLGIAQRSGVALALAGLMTAFAWRRHRTVPASQLQRQNYQTLAAAIPMGVACWTRKGELIVCNEQYRARLDLKGAAVGYHEAVKCLISGGYMKLINDDENNRLLELHRQDGTCLLIDERPLANGEFMTLVSDVTERKKADTMLHSIREEQRLLARRYHDEKLKAEAASRSKTNFLAHLSHDIRTPLNHIIGFAELMRHQSYGPLGDRRYVEYVQSIKASGEHLLASFATILDLAELDNGQKSLRQDPVSVDGVIAHSIDQYRAQAERDGITMIHGQRSGAVVKGDRLGLQRMLANIVENSLRFTPAGGSIMLAAFAARDGVVIEITDTGTGMAEERLASLSQPFVLGDATFTREGKGPGLGISISRAIAELSGGHMAIDSSPGLGTTVAISLPLRAATLQHAA